MIRSIITIICMILCHVVQGSNNWKEVYSNDLQENQATMEVIGNDPYLVFQVADPLNPNSRFDFLFKQTKSNEQSMLLTLFWDLKNQGFSEEQRISYHMESPGVEKVRTIDLIDLSKLFKFELKELTKIRIDPELSMNESFVFSLSDPVEATECLFYESSKTTNVIDFGLPIKSTNNLGNLNGLLKITNGDPFIQFDLNHSPIKQGERIALQFIPTSTKQRFHYIEFFWETTKHGISEQNKAFLNVPTDLSSETWIEFDLFNRVNSIEPNTSEITSLRIDFQYPLSSPFQFKIRRIPPTTASSIITEKMTLRYSINPQWLNKRSIFEYAKKQTSVELVHRISKNLAFFVFYFLVIFTFIAIFTVYLIKKIKFGKI